MRSAGQCQRHRGERRKGRRSGRMPITAQKGEKTGWGKISQQHHDRRGKPAKQSGQRSLKKNNPILREEANKRTLGCIPFKEKLSLRGKKKTKR